jgi:plasmid maintenance system antidote protein VapI
MTVKELAELLDVTKNTINNKVQKLHIEPQIKGNRYELNDNDAQSIIKSIYPSNYQEYLEKANLGKTTKAKNNNNDNNDNLNDKIDNQNDKYDNQTAKNAANNNQNDAQTAQNINEKLIAMLEKSLTDKEDTIKAQQKQIEMLLTTNAALTAKVAMLEDKSQEQKDIVIHEPSVAAPTSSEQTTEQEQPKLSWWQRLFN